MKLQTSLALVCTLLATAVLDARTPQRSTQPDESRQAIKLRTRAHQAAQQIRLVQSDSVQSDPVDPLRIENEPVYREAAQRSAVSATQRTMNAGGPPLTGPLPPPQYAPRYGNPMGPYTQRHIPYGSAPPDPEWRSRQPATMGHIFRDDNYQDRCLEEQFCQRVWQCAGGRDQCCFQRWERDFWRSYDQRGDTHLNWLRGIHGCFVQNCFRGGGCGGCGGGCCGGGCGDCGGGGCGGCGGDVYGEGHGPVPGPVPGHGPGYHPMHGHPGPHGTPTPAGHAQTREKQKRGAEGRFVERDPYVSAIEGQDPHTEIVGNIQILQDRVIR